MKFMNVCAAALVLAAPAFAQDSAAAAGSRAGDWTITYRGTGVVTNAHDAITTSAGGATGLSADVSSDVMPTLGFTYFLSDEFAIEAILGATHHNVRAQGGATDILVHDTWVLPPIVTLQYRPTGGGKFDPYIGAGINYMLFFGGDDHNGFQVDLDNGFGYVLQAGVNISVSEQWFLNIDVKKVWFQTDASINGGSLVSDVGIDPWVISAGFGYKF